MVSSDIHPQAANSRSCKRPSSRKAGSATMPSSPAMARRKPCPGRFSFAAYLGAVMSLSPNGWKGALICLVAIFLPSFLLVIGALPFWEDLRRRSGARAALAGVNAAVVGLLIAAFYDPIWTVGIPMQWTSRSPSRPSFCSSSGRCHRGPWSSSAPLAGGSARPLNRLVG
jgi:hypothetical protein